MITALSHHVLCTSLVPSATPEWIWGTPRSWADRRARQRRLSDEADARPDARPVSRISHRPACPPWARPASSWRLGGMAEADQGRPGPGLLRCRVAPGHGVDEVVWAVVGASGGAGDVGLTVAAVVA